MNERERPEQLREQAEALLPVLASQARRAYVLEITGTPKAGKTSTIAMVRHFFKTVGYRVKVLQERASVCPLPMKGHFFFNTWTTCTMIAELLEHVDRKYEIIIVDRGFFDALLWLELQQQRGQVEDDEVLAFKQFVTVERWRSLVDATIVMKVTPETAMKREHSDRLLERQGTVMNVPSLDAFNEVLARVEAEHENSFSISHVDAGHDDRKRVASDVIEMVLDKIQEWSDPSVAGIPRPILDAYMDGHQTSQWSAETWPKLKEHIQARTRSEAERDDEWVQLIACGVLERPDGVFVFRRSDRDKIHRYGKQLIWRACHVEFGDDEGECSLSKVMRLLDQRLRESLYVRRGFGKMVPLALVWTPLVPDPKARRGSTS